MAIDFSQVPSTNRSQDNFQIAFQESFPDGYTKLKTSGEGRLCGFHAVIGSMKAQFSELEHPTLDNLQAVLRSVEYADFARNFALDNQNDFFIEQLAVILNIWAFKSTTVNIQLGYILDGSGPVLLHVREAPERRTIIVWVHNDNLQGMLDNYTGVGGHYSAIRPGKSQTEDEIHTFDFDQYEENEHDEAFALSDSTIAACPTLSDAALINQDQASFSAHADNEATSTYGVWCTPRASNPGTANQHTTRNAQSRSADEVLHLKSSRISMKTQLDRTNGIHSEKKEGKIKRRIKDDWATKLSRGSKHKAHLYHAITNTPLTTDDVHGHFNISIDDHMPHIKLYITNPQRFKAARLPHAAKQELQDESCSQKSEVNVDEVIDGISMQNNGYELNHAVYVNYQCSPTLQPLCLHSSIWDQKSTDQRSMISKIPSHIMNKAQTIEEKGLVPILVRMTFDNEHIAQEGLFLSNLPWAQAFKDAIKTPHVQILILLEGHGSTIQQLESVRKVFANCLNQGSPLDQWHMSCKRYVYTVGKLHDQSTASISNKSYDYTVRCGYHDFNEFATVHGVGIIQQNSRCDRNKLYHYENRVHNMKIMRVPGGEARGLHLGFLPCPGDDEFPLVQGTSLKIDFSTTPDGEEKPFFIPDTEEDTHVFGLSRTDERQNGNRDIDNDTSSDTSGDSDVLFTQQKLLRESCFLLGRSIGTIQLVLVKWTAIVSKPLAFAPANTVPIWLFRPWSKSKTSPGWVDDRHLDFVDDSNIIDELDIATRISRNPGHKVKVNIKHSSKVGVQNLAALDRLANPPRHVKRVPFNDLMQKVFICNHPHTLPHINLFKGLEDELEGPAKKLSLLEIAELYGGKKLNDTQSQAFRGAEHSRAGVHIITGAPATGKSFMLLSFATPYFIAKSRQLLLFTSASNSTVDPLARDLDTRLRCLQSKGHAPEDRYVLRLYSRYAEKCIARNELKKRQPPTPVRPQVSTIATEELDSIETVLHARVINLDDILYQPVQDKRVQDVLLSVGIRMLIIANLFGSKSNPAVNDEWNDFRSLHRCRLDGIVDSEQRAQYLREADKLFTAAIQGAAAVVCTTAVAGSAKFLKAAEEHIAQIFVDEATKVKTESLLPIVSAPLKKIAGIFLVGDPHQLPPFGTVDKSKSVFAAQLDMTLMEQLLRQGWKTCALDIQERMVSQIASLCNNFSCGGSLKNGKSTSFKKHPQASGFRDWCGIFAKGSKKAGTSVLYLDFLPGDLNIVREDNFRSRSNDLIAVHHVNIVESLLTISPTATICLLTGYRSQAKIYQTALTNMQIARIEGVERISVRTIDESQGEQWNYVCLDLLCSQTAGFLGKRQRINVALTRARDGLIISTSSDAIYKLKPYRGDCLAVLLRSLKQYRHKIDSNSTDENGIIRYPACRFLTAGSRP